MFEGGRDVNRGTFSTASYGYCVQEFRGRIFHHGILLVAASVIRQRLWLSSAGEFHPMLSKNQPVWLPDNLTHVEKKLFQF
jgi:hypothetical protein